MRRVAVAALMATVVGSQSFACDDHSGECQIEAWRYQSMMGMLTIEGSATCDSGMVSIRLYDGETYLGNAIGTIDGHALTAVATGIDKPGNLVLKYSIEPGF